MRAILSAFRTFVRFALVWFCLFPLPLGVWDGLRLVIEALPELFFYLFYTLSCCKPVELELYIRTHIQLHTWKAIKSKERYRRLTCDLWIVSNAYATYIVVTCSSNFTSTACSMAENYNILVVVFIKIENFTWSSKEDSSLFRKRNVISMLICDFLSPITLYCSLYFLILLWELCFYLAKYGTVVK